MICWANELGGCDRISREHPYSKSLWERADHKKPLIAESQHRTWTMIGGIESASSKILCRNHNSLLSGLDAEVGKLRALARYRESGIGEDIAIDGPLFTRWCIKAFVGFLVTGWVGVPKNSISIPKKVVELAFGQRDITHTMMGIYTCLNLSSTSDSNYDIGVATIARAWGSGDSPVFPGAEIRLHGFSVFLWLGDSPIPDDYIRDITLGVPQLRELIFRPIGFTSIHPTTRQQLTVRIVWPQNINKNMLAYRHLQTQRFALEYGLMAH